MSFILPLEIFLPECTQNIELAYVPSLPFQQKWRENCILLHQNLHKRKFWAQIAVLAPKLTIFAPKMLSLFSQNIDTLMVT